MSHKNISSRELLSWPDDSVVALSLAADSKAGKDNRINTTLALWILLVPFVLGGLSLVLHPGPRFVCTSERGTFVFKAAISCDPLPTHGILTMTPSLVTGYKLLEDFKERHTFLHVFQLQNVVGIFILFTYVLC